MWHEVAMAPMLKGLDTNFRDRWSSKHLLLLRKPRHFCAVLLPKTQSHTPQLEQKPLKFRVAKR